MKETLKEAINKSAENNINKMYLPETRTHVHRHVFMPFFKSVVFFHVMQIISPDNNGPGHLHLENCAC